MFDILCEIDDCWESMKGAPDLATIKMRSSSTDVISLTDSSGIGRFNSKLWEKECNSFSLQLEQDL